MLSKLMANIRNPVHYTRKFLKANTNLLFLYGSEGGNIQQRERDYSTMLVRSFNQYIIGEVSLALDNIHAKN